MVHFIKIVLGVKYRGYWLINNLSYNSLTSTSVIENYEIDLIIKIKTFTVLKYFSRNSFDSRVGPTQAAQRLPKREFTVQTGGKKSFGIEEEGERGLYENMWIVGEKGLSGNKRSGKWDILFLLDWRDWKKKQTEGMCETWKVCWVEFTLLLPSLRYFVKNCWLKWTLKIPSRFSILFKYTRLTLKIKQRRFILYLSNCIVFYSSNKTVKV